MDSRKFVRINSDFNVWYQTLDEDDMSFVEVVPDVVLPIIEETFTGTPEAVLQEDTVTEDTVAVAPSETIVEPVVPTVSETVSVPEVQTVAETVSVPEAPDTGWTSEVSSGSGFDSGSSYDSGSSFDSGGGFDSGGDFD